MSPLSSWKLDTKHTAGCVTGSPPGGKPSRTIVLLAFPQHLDLNLFHSLRHAMAHAAKRQFKPGQMPPQLTMAAAEAGS